jgi:hypothetical protein
VLEMREQVKMMVENGLGKAKKEVSYYLRR